MSRARRSSRRQNFLGRRRRRASSNHGHRHRRPNLLLQLRSPNPRTWFMRDQLGIISHVPRGVTAEELPAGAAAAAAAAGTSFLDSSSACARIAAEDSLRTGATAAERGRATTKRAAVAGRIVRRARACIVACGRCRQDDQNVVGDGQRPWNERL